MRNALDATWKGMGLSSFVIYCFYAVVGALHIQNYYKLN